MAANPEIMNEKAVTFNLNGKDIEAYGDETILQAAKRNDIEIPYLCYKEGYRPDGNCRVCMVEIEGERVLAPSCCRVPTEDMKVNSENERAIHSQKMVLELLLSDMPQQGSSSKNRIAFNAMFLALSLSDKIMIAAEPIKHPYSCNVSKSSGTSPKEAGSIPPDAPPGK